MSASERSAAARSRLVGGSSSGVMATKRAENSASLFSMSLTTAHERHGLSIRPVSSSAEWSSGESLALVNSAPKRKIYSSARGRQSRRRK